MVLQFIKAPPELISLILPEMIVSAVSIATGQVTSLLRCLRLSRGKSMCEISLCYIRFKQQASTQRTHFIRQPSYESDLALEIDNLERSRTGFRLG